MSMLSPRWLKIPSCCFSESLYLCALTSSSWLPLRPYCITFLIQEILRKLQSRIRKAHVDTRATIFFVRTALSSLDTKMMAFDSDISKSNAYVNTQVIALAARGETTTNLLANIFKGYETAQDSEFALLFITRKKDAYDEGGDITVTFPLWMLLKTNSRPECSSKLGVHQPRNKNRS
jgi:hypothetical protein